MRLLRAGILILFALLYTGLNALTPLKIDDAAYICYVRQIAGHPFDPYGFVIQWYDVPQPANDVLAPPVLPYSVALGMHFFGENPALLKLSLLPWVLLLTFALNAHLRRFAPGLELELTAFLLFSPALLPSLNLMLDVPALALSLSAVFLFLLACDTNSLGRAALAGLTAGVAMQTKYTGIVSIGAMAAASLVYRRPTLGLAAAASAAPVFISWEIFVAILYGRSHFLTSLGANSSTFEEKISLIPIFFSQFGGVAAALALLGLAAAGWSKRTIVAASGGIVLAYAAVALLDANYEGVVHPSALLFGDNAAAHWKIQLAEILFDVFSGVCGIALIRAIGRLWTESAVPVRADTRFLLAWLVVDATAYVVLTPFPALRRVLGVFVILTLVFGRLAARTCTTAERSRVLRGVVAFGCLLGLGFYAIDWLDARPFRDGAEQASAFVNANGGGRVWYNGRWGFRYYAERCGMLPVVPRYEASSAYLELPSASRMESGDWLVIAEEPERNPDLDVAALPLEKMTQIVIDDRLPLRTVPCFYVGRTPLEHRETPRLTIVIYRITRECAADICDD